MIDEKDKTCQFKYTIISIYRNKGYSQIKRGKINYSE